MGELYRVVQFLACHMRKVQHEASVDHAKEEADALAKACANETGPAWNGVGNLKECLSKDAGIDVQTRTGYKKAIEWVGKHQHWDHAPFLFLNGRPLLCTSPTYCTSIWTPEGEQKLPVQGTLLDVVCSLLDSPPKACKGQEASTPVTSTPTVTPFCETCWEVSSFRWPYNEKGSWGTHAAVERGLLIVALVVAGIVAVGAWGARRSYAARYGGHTLLLPIDDEDDCDD